MIPPVLCGFIGLSLLCILSAIAARRLIEACVSFLTPAQSPPVLSLAFVVGVPCSLLLFSLWARIMPGFALALIMSWVSLWISGAFLSGHWKINRSLLSLNRPDRVCLSYFGVFFITCFFFRCFWPAIHWDNSIVRLGVERLFNLSLQQAFTYGSQWPVDNLWLSGEPLDYHVLLRSLPGLATWIARTVFHNPLAAGAIYLLNDALFLSLAPLAITAWTLTLLSGFTERSRFIIAIGLGVLTFLTPHATAAWASLQVLFGWRSSIDFWLIQHEVVPHTVNFFPSGLLLSGESHSYAQAPFLAISWCGALAAFCRLPSKSLAFLLAMLAAVMTLAHPSTALLGFFVASIPLGVLLTEALVKKNWSQLAQRATLVASIGFIAALLVLPEQLFHQQPDLRWVLVGPSLASSLLPFLSAQLAPLLIIFILLCAAIGALLNQESIEKPFILLLGFLLCGLAFYFQHPALAVVAFLAVLVFWLLPPQQRLTAFPLFLGTLCAWIVPEILVSDWAIDNRTDWVRFNTVMRFWLEGYYIIPFTLLLALSPQLVRVWQIKSWRIVLGSMVALLFCFACLSFYPLLKNRIQRTPEKFSTDGFAFLANENPLDWALIRYLASIPEPVVVAEACGTGGHPATPPHYGKAGRLSAFSGRSSLCGWGRHTWMFQRVFRRGPQKGADIWSSFISYQNALILIAQASRGESVQVQDLTSALQLLRTRGITHVAWGELEQEAYGKIYLDTLAAVVKGTVVFQVTPNAGIIKLDAL